MSFRSKKLSLLLLIPFLFQCSKLPDENLLSNVTQELYETTDYIILRSENSTPTKTMIFYPGGLVDPHSYLKWQDQLVSNDQSLQIITVKMPSNLAVITSKKGAKLFDHYPDIKEWYIAGHSLGGAMATNLVDEYPDKLDALIYLAAYPSDERIKNYSGGVLSISAENDGLTTPEDIQERIDDLPEPFQMDSINDFPSEVRGKTMYYEIKGGNHAQFGNYGEQDNDKEATISSDQQQAILVELIQNYLLEL